MIGKVFNYFSSKFKTEPASSEVEEKSIEELYPGMSDKEITAAINQKDDDDLTLEESFWKLGGVLHREQAEGRSRAISELIEFRYQILADEYGNPFKEIINFTLRYFQKFAESDRQKAKQLLFLNFPIMAVHILKYDPKERTEGQLNTTINKQDAYHEFLNFVGRYFKSNYSDKSERDLAIHANFNHFITDVISFADKFEEN